VVAPVLLLALGLPIFLVLIFATERREEGRGQEVMLPGMEKLVETMRKQIEDVSSLFTLALPRQSSELHP
jgi:hypothetical protein